jgi:hypothetical protein
MSLPPRARQQVNPSDFCPCANVAVGLAHIMVLANQSVLLCDDIRVGLPNRHEVPCARQTFMKNARLVIFVGEEGNTDTENEESVTTRSGVVISGVIYASTALIR